MTWRARIKDFTHRSNSPTGYEPDDLGFIANQRLHAAGLIGGAVVGIHVVDDDNADEIVDVTVLPDASDADITNVHDALSTLAHRVVRRPVGFSASSRDPE